MITDLLLRYYFASQAGLLLGYITYRLTQRFSAKWMSVGEQFLLARGILGLSLALPLIVLLPQMGIHLDHGAEMITSTEAVTKRVVFSIPQFEPETQSVVTEFATSGGRMLDGNTLDIGLLDGLDDYVKTKEAQISKLDQVVQLEKTEKEVIQEVKKAYFDYQKAQIQVQSTLQNVNYLRRSADLSELKLEKNEIQISEYMKAEIDLAEGVSKLHKAIAEFLTARSALNHSIGIPDYLKFGDKL